MNTTNGKGDTNSIFITENVRDAMQGLNYIVPAQQKADYLNSLLNVGFERIDMGYLVSPKPLPQFKDLYEVLSLIEPIESRTRLMVQINNPESALIACSQPLIKSIGYASSISEVYLMRSLHVSQEQSLTDLLKIVEVTNRHDKELVVYLTMAFGNPYNEEWSPEKVFNLIQIYQSWGIKKIVFCDTYGGTNQFTIAGLYSLICYSFPTIEFGLHLFTSSQNWFEKIDAAYRNGCRHFDGVIHGMGECPATCNEKEHVGIVNTQHLLEFCGINNIKTNLVSEAFENAIVQSLLTFTDIPLE